MVRLDRVSLVFGSGTADKNEALRQLSLQVFPGDFITIIGSNGAGKTSLYNVISGMHAVTSGRVFISQPGADEREITREAEWKRARYIGRIFQNPLLGTAGRMTLADNMMIYHRKGYRGFRISLNQKMMEYFRSRLSELGMGLENRLGDNVELFSGGQRQALTLLMTVLSKPSLLLLDEHTAALDPHNAELVMKLTLRFAKEYKLTVMMITHNMKDALEQGNRLLMMDGGRIILDIGPGEKEKLRVADIVERFRTIKKQEFASDEILLS
ncbi:MAG: ATP-binding cassette domain-containing protein [Treponema sp.]|jgi:putative ABC transport system ATP-binding protein|nr:ATP-binding cassette domain-containing protein [Treponema sp.]